MLRILREKKIIFFNVKKKLTFLLLCILRHLGRGGGINAIADMSTKNVIHLWLPLFLNGK